MKLKKKINIEAYTLAKKQIVDIANKYNFLSIYEYGSYRNPGLSDIDLFLVIKKKKNPLIKEFLKNIEKTKNLKFFFEYSTIMVIKRQLLKNILLFDDLKLKRVFGNKIIIHKYKKLKNLLTILSILEWLPERTLRLKENIDNFNNINLRQHLGLLNSLKYTYVKLNKYIDEKRIIELCKKINMLRSDQNILKKKNEILFFSKIVFKFSNHLINIFSKNSCINELKTKIRGSFTIKFPSTYKIIYSEEKLDTLQQRSITVPVIYSLPFAFHTKKKNTLSKLMKKHVLLSKNYKININEKKINFIFNKRNKLINDNIKSLVENNVFKGLYKFGWFLKK